MFSKAFSDALQPQDEEFEPVYCVNDDVEMNYTDDMVPVGNLNSMLEIAQGHGNHRKTMEALLMCRAADSFEVEFSKADWILKIAEIGIELGMFDDSNALVEATRIFDEQLNDVIVFGIGMICGT